MNVLSLFGGTETGLIALKELGAKINNYYSSEIDKYTASVAKYNHPEIKHLGPIEDYELWELPKIDLILAGPPCQGFSIAGKGLNWDDPRSQLFFKAIEILWKYEPEYFLFENVASMKKEIRSEINELMEVNSVMINSALVSAQNRKRLYWCNWDINQPKDKGLFLKDIVEFGEPLADKSQTIPSTIYKENAKSMIKRNKKGLLVYVNDKINSSQDGKIVDVSGKSLTLTAGHNNYPKIGKDKNNFRKLTPIECERLQTLTDNYTLNGADTNGKTIKISNTQRYRMIGNGWTKDVIKHILSHANCIYT